MAARDPIVTFSHCPVTNYTVRCRREGDNYVYYCGCDNLLVSKEPVHCEIVSISDHPVLFVPDGQLWKGALHTGGLTVELSLDRLPLGCGRYMLPHELGQIRHADDDKIRTYPEYVTVRFTSGNNMQGVSHEGKLVRHVF